MSKHVDGGEGGAGGINREGSSLNDQGLRLLGPLVGVLEAGFCAERTQDGIIRAQGIVMMMTRGKNSPPKSDIGRWMEKGNCGRPGCRRRTMIKTPHRHQDALFTVVSSSSALFPPLLGPPGVACRRPQVLFTFLLPHAPRPPCPPAQTRPAPRTNSYVTGH